MCCLLNSLLDHNTWNALQKQFDRNVNNEDCLTDIYDGEQYKKHSQPGGFLSSAYPANISFTINTDGVAVFKSSAAKICPV